MIMGYVFFWAVIGSIVLVGVSRALEGLVIQCQSCGRYRVRRAYCARCGIVGNPVPEPPKHKNSRSNHERQVRFE